MGIRLHCLAETFPKVGPRLIPQTFERRQGPYILFKDSPNVPLTDLLVIPSLEYRQLIGMVADRNSNDIERFNCVPQQPDSNSVCACLVCQTGRYHGFKAMFTRVVRSEL